MNKSLQQSLHNARAALLAARTPAGSWEGELSSSALSTATAVFALHQVAFRGSGFQPVLAEMPQAGRLCPSINAGLHWLAQTQNPDGGWGDTIVSKSNISTTVLCWSALRAQTAEACIDPAVQAKCEAWLTQHAGGIDPAHLVPAIIARYGKDKTFSVPILTMAALAGRLGDDANAWKNIRQLPFELAAFPQRWFKWLHLPVVSYALPALIAIGWVRHRMRPTRNPIARFARSLARRRALALLEKIQPPGGGFLEATPLTSFVVMSLLRATALSPSPLYSAERAGVRGSGVRTSTASLRTTEPLTLTLSPEYRGEGTDPTSRVIQRGVEFLLHSARPDGSWPIDTNLATWVTTLAINALAISPGLSRLLPDSEKSAVRDWLLAQQYRREHPYTLANPGAWAWTDLPGGVPDADDTPGTLLALAHLGRDDPRSIEAAAAGIRWLIDIQNRDGGIPTFCRGWGKLAFDRSSPDLTAHAIRAMLTWRDRLPIDVRKPIQRAVRYLLREQRSDGSWIPLWFGNQHAADDLNPTYGTARVLKIVAPLLGARLENDFAPGSAAVARAQGFLLSTQNADGGWGGAAATASSIEETALAIEALANLPVGSAPRTDSQAHDGENRPQCGPYDAIRRGVAWLIEQTRGGTHFPPAPIGFYFAKLWYYEKLYPLIFTVAALESAACFFVDIDKSTE